MLGHPGYGLQGKVLSADKNLKGKIRIEFDNIHEPEVEEVKKRSSQAHYMPGYAGAKRLGISTHLISRITGTIYLLLSPTEEEKNSDRPRRPKKVNVGLSLKFNKSKEEIPGWSKKVDSGWLYSANTIKVLDRYINEFPDFFDFLSQHSGSDDFTDQQVFGEDGVERACKLHEFVQTLPCINAERRVIGSLTTVYFVLSQNIYFNFSFQAWGSEGIDANTLSYLAKLGAPKLMKLRPLVMQVRPHLLFKPDLMSGSSPPDPSANYQLLDRVVNVRQGYSVPMGLRGTVVGIKNASKVMDVVYEILFDEEFAGALPIKGMPEVPNRIYHLPVWAMINLTHGIRQHSEREKQGKPTAVVRPSGSALNKPTEPASRNPPKQNHSSYKASLEHQPAQAKQVTQPKLLTRKKAENAPVATAPENKPVSSVNRIPAKSAPSPSSLPSPFMDIWNSLVQQHEQQQQQQQQGATSLITTTHVTAQEPPKNKQPPPQVKTSREPPVPVAPKLPSLQEAARNLPKITKLPKGASAVPPGPLPRAAPPPPEVLMQAIPPPPLPAGVSIPLGPSLSVQQLFDMASQAAIANPIIPRQPPPAVFSFCLQLMDVMQQKGIWYHPVLRCVILLVLINRRLVNRMWASRLQLLVTTRW
jgi:5'-3' exoribonuclease 1